MTDLVDVNLENNEHDNVLCCRRIVPGTFCFKAINRQKCRNFFLDRKVAYSQTMQTILAVYMIIFGLLIIDDFKYWLCNALKCSVALRQHSLKCKFKYDFLQT